MPAFITGSIAATTLSATGAVDFGSTTLTIAAPTADGHATSKAYVDNLVSGLTIREAVQAASTGDLVGTYSSGAKTITETGGPSGVQPSVDGYTLQLNDRVLLKDQGTTAEVGVYSLTQISDSGLATPWVLTRATDLDTDAELQRGALIFVVQGSQEHTSWLLQDAEAATVENQTWQQFASGVTLSSTNGSITITAGYDIDVNPAYAFNWTGAQQFSGGGSLRMGSGIQLSFGNSDQVTMLFTGTDFTIDNTAVGNTIIQQGADDSTTAVIVKNDTGDELWKVSGVGDLLFKTISVTGGNSSGAGGGFGTADVSGAAIPTGGRLIKLIGTNLSADALNSGTRSMALFSPTEGQILTIYYTDGGSGFDVEIDLGQYAAPDGSTGFASLRFSDGQSVTLIGLDAGTWANMHGGHS